jgi:MSHA biogenesis protein MshQ
MQVADIVRLIPTKDASRLGKDVVNKVNLTADLYAVTLTDSNGMINYQYNSSDNFVYTREANAVIDKFNADIDLQVTSIADDDGITANDTDANGTNGILTLNPAGLDVRFGRWFLKNSFGPETSQRQVSMVTQYWNGTAYVTNSADSFTLFDATNATITDLSLLPATSTASGSGTFSSGSASIIMSAPGANNKGAVKLNLSVPAWLQYDWQNTDSNLDGPYTENPSSNIMFGIYRGNDRIISWREVFN